MEKTTNSEGKVVPGTIVESHEKIKYEVGEVDRKTVNLYLNGKFEKKVLYQELLTVYSII